MAAEPLRIGSAPPRAPSHCRAGAPGLTLTPGDRGPDCGQELRAPWPASVAPPPALAGRAPPPCRPPRSPEHAAHGGSGSAARFTRIPMKERGRHGYGTSGAASTE